MIYLFLTVGWSFLGVSFIVSFIKEKDDIKKYLIFISAMLCVLLANQANASNIATRKEINMPISANFVWNCEDSADMSRRICEGYGSCCESIEPSSGEPQTEEQKAMEIMEGQVNE